MTELAGLYYVRVQPTERALIADLYQRSVPVKEIADRTGRKLGTVRSVIQKLLKSGELKPRKRSKPDAAEFRYKILMLYRSGKNVKQITRKVGGCETAVQQVVNGLKRVGLHGGAP